MICVTNAHLPTLGVTRMRTLMGRLANAAIIEGERRRTERAAWRLKRRLRARRLRRRSAGSTAKFGRRASPCSSPPWT